MYNITDIKVIKDFMRMCADGDLSDESGGSGAVPPLLPGAAR